MKWNISQVTEQCTDWWEAVKLFDVVMGKCDRNDWGYYSLRRRCEWSEACWFWGSSAGTIIEECALGIEWLKVLRCQLGDYERLGICQVTTSVESTNWVAECPRAPVGWLGVIEALSQLVRNRSEILKRKGIEMLEAHQCFWKWRRRLICWDDWVLQILYSVSVFAERMILYWTSATVYEAVTLWYTCFGFLYYLMRVRYAPTVIKGYHLIIVFLIVLNCDWMNIIVRLLTEKLKITAAVCYIQVEIRLQTCSIFSSPSLTRNGVHSM